MPARSATDGSTSHGASSQGASSAQMRLHNQRLILQRLRRMGAASRADLARAASLTNTAVGDIVQALSRRGLVRAVGKRHEGQRGQPATMLSLDPGGAYGIGVRLDRTRIETVLADLGGAVLGHRVHDLVLPPPARALELLRADIAELIALIPPARRGRIAGLGLARPWNLGSWLGQLDLPRDIFGAWDDVPFAATLCQACGLPVHEENDGTAAATAELFHGGGRALDDFLYVFVGPAIGGGIVLGGHCVRGATGNAGDLAVMPVAPSTLPSAPPRPDGRELLLGRASLTALVRHLRFRGATLRDPADLAAALADVPDAADEWLEDCVLALVDPLLAAGALLDVPVVIIDSDLDPPWIDRLIARAQAALAAAAAEARSPPRLLRGQLGGLAGALGAATLPLFFHFGPSSGRHAGAAATSYRQGGSYALVA
jgi:predicted NBD/HSP70 family sugar kinase